MRKYSIAASAVAVVSTYALAQTPVMPATNGSSASPPAAPTVCVNDAARHRLDFWIGEWNVTSPDGKPAGKSVIQSISGGCGILENWTASNGATGKSINAYNPVLKQWQQYWVGQGGLVSEYRSGRFDGKSVAFFLKDDAKPLSVHRLTFTPINATTVRQHSEISEDGGKNWKTEYDLYYHRTDQQ
jgi:hypothetical protein